MTDAPTTSIVSTIILMILLIGSMGCGHDAIEGAMACTYDADCNDDQFCISAQCTPECTRDDDCPAGTYCEVYQREDEPDPIQACLDPSADDGVGCEDDQQCRDKLNDPDARCGLHDRCVLTDPSDNQDDSNDSNDNDIPELGPVIVVEQLDADGSPVTPDDDDDVDGEDSDQDGSGEDDSSDTSTEVRPVRVGTVVVRDDQDKIVGYGRTLAVHSPTEDNPSAELGEPSKVSDDGQCIVEPETAPHTSLGAPAGKASIELIDGDRLPFNAESSTPWSLQIIANDRACPIGPEENNGDHPFGQYRVLLCDTEATESLPPSEDCEPLAEGPFTGFFNMEVTFDD